MPCATYASKGVDLHHERSKLESDRPWLNADNSNWKNKRKTSIDITCPPPQDEFRQILYVSSQPRSYRSDTTDVPSSDLNEENQNYWHEDEEIDTDLDCFLDQKDYSQCDNNLEQEVAYTLSVLNQENNNNNKYYSARIPIEAYPESLINWPPKTTNKNKRLEEIKKQVKQLSCLIKMTIANDGLQNGDSDNGIPSNPAPFSTNVDMTLIESGDIKLSSNGSSLPSWDDIKQQLTPEHYKEGKQILRDSDYGLSHQIRADLWLELCKHHSKEIFTEQFYWDTVKQMYGTINIDDCAVSLPAFVDTHHLPKHALSDHGQQICRRIMSVIGFLNPSITYAPLVYPIAVTMLHFMEEVDVYNCLSVLISHPSNTFITQTKVNHEALWRAAVKLARKHFRGSFATLIKYGVTPEQVDSSFQNYLGWIFECLPLPYLVRVMDCYLLEGSKVLLRCALAIMHLFSKECSRDSTLATTLPTKGVHEAIIRFSTNIKATPSKLLKTAFGIRGFSKAEINQMVVKTEMLLKSNRLPTSDSTNYSLGHAASLEGLPTSAAQTDVQMMSHTMTIKEGSKSPAPRVRAMGEYPIKNVKSSIANMDQLLTVWSWLPIRNTMHQPILLYTTEEHGSSLTTFYQRTEKHYPTLLLVRTTRDYVFGAYCSTALAERNHLDASGHRQTYFGTGETFVFSLEPEMAKHQWVGITQQQENRELSHVDHSHELFIHADSDMVSIGGGKGQALYLDHELRFGKTEKCETFDNPPLCPDSDFEVKVIEVYGFTEPF